MIVVGLNTASHSILSLAPVNAASPETEVAFAMMRQGQGADALRALSAKALSRGGWGPAPDDIVVFDDTLPEVTRAAVLVIDKPPAECAYPRLARSVEECHFDFDRKQNQVRFGKTTFADRDERGNLIPRAEYDDLLSTYVEEMAHSWQEYLFETEGRGSGARTRQIEWSEGLYWGHGWEYQAKMYVLNLDGTLLHLSDTEREALRGSICKSDSYANPVGHHVMAYRAPPAWPNREGWPTTNPTPEEFKAFCR